MIHGHLFKRGTRKQQRSRKETSAGSHQNASTPSLPLTLQPLRTATTHKRTHHALSVWLPHPKPSPCCCCSASFLVGRVRDCPRWRRWPRWRCSSWRRRWRGGVQGCCGCIRRFGSVWPCHLQETAWRSRRPLRPLHRLTRQGTQGRRFHYHFLLGHPGTL